MQLRVMFLIGLVAATMFTSCGGDDRKDDQADKKPVEIEQMDQSYSAGAANMNGFIAYDKSTDTKRPVVLVVHEWWGLNDYIKGRVRQLAEMGYLAMAVDLYGNRIQGDTPEEAGQLALPFYTRPAMAKERFDAALATILSHKVADTSRVAAIGYCFGGSQVLNMAKLGADLNGVVSFHGNLAGVTPEKSLLKADILVCHGESDEFVSQEEITMFRKQLDSIGAPYTFKSYPGATHAFTNPEATAKGEKFKIPIRYNAAADSASWNDMKAFFNKIF